MRSNILVLVAGLVAAHAGCRKPTSTLAPTNAPSQSPSVSYEVRGEGDAVTKGITENGSFASGKYTLELKAGRVFANGKDYGSVQEGDSVLLERDGQLFVNGEMRQSE